MVISYCIQSILISPAAQRRKTRRNKKTLQSTLYPQKTALLSKEVYQEKKKTLFALESRK